MLGLYFLCLIVATDVVNLRLGVELLSLAVLVAAVFLSHRARAFVEDWWFFLLGLVLWNLSGAIAGKSTFPVHLHFMMNADAWLAFGQQPVALVQHALGHPGRIGPLDVATSAAYNLHLAEPFVAGYFLWRLNRAVYFRFAASVLCLLVAGFITFIVYPAMPPWMSSLRYGVPSHVFNGFNPVVHAHPLPFHGTPIFYVFKLTGDAVAAFPSEHAAFPVLELLAFTAVLGARAWPWALWVAVVLFSVVYLGEHWVIDALAGYLYAVCTWFGIRYVTGIRSSTAGLIPADGPMFPSDTTRVTRSP